MADHPEGSPAAAHAAGRGAVQSQYSREAVRYEERWSRYLRISLDRTVQALRPRPDERLLDVGCGTGLLLRSVGDLEPAVEAVGVDVSPDMLRVARERATPGALILADAARLPFADGSFHAAVSSSSLHHWPEPLVALREIGRVLRPGGRLILTDWADDHLPTRVLSSLLRLTDRSHRRTFRVEEATLLLQGAGFRVTRRERYRAGWKWGLMTLSAERPARG